LINQKLTTRPFRNESFRRVVNKKNEITGINLWVEMFRKRDERGIWQQAADRHSPKSAV